MNYNKHMYVSSPLTHNRFLGLQEEPLVTPDGGVRFYSLLILSPIIVVVIWTSYSYMSLSNV